MHNTRVYYASVWHKLNPFGGLCMKKIIGKVISIVCILSLLLGNSIQLVAANDTAVEEMTYFCGHYYKVYTDAVSWIDAKSKCELLGGHLATITTKEEDDFAFTLMCEAGLSKILFGLYNAGDSETPDWRWVTDESLDYTRWGNGEPNYDYDGTEAYGGYYCGSWNDYRSDEVNEYICEWDSITSYFPNENSNQLRNYSFSYNGADYFSTAYYEAKETSEWVDVQQTTISSGNFDWTTAITSTISMNGGSALHNDVWKESQFYTDPNNNKAISGLNTAETIVSLVNGFITGGRSGITNIHMKLQSNGSEKRMLLLYGSPIESHYAGQTLWLSDILINSHSGEAAYFLHANDDEDQLLRKCFDGLKSDGKYSMEIKFAKAADFEKYPYKYSIVVSDNREVFQYPILHNGTSMKVYYTPEGGKREYAFDATSLICSEKIAIANQVGNDIVDFLTAGEWMKDNGNWMDNLKIQSISGGSHFKKTVGCNSFYLKAKAKTPLTYTSDNTDVATVSANGKVSIHNVGRANIVITASQTNKYALALKKITLIVNPRPTKIQNTKRTNDVNATVKWNKGNDVDGYILQISRNSNFFSSKEIKCENRNKTSMNLKNLSKKKTYYIRCCTYKIVNGQEFRSSWSSKKVINYWTAH